MAVVHYHHVRSSQRNHLHRWVTGDIQVRGILAVAGIAVILFAGFMAFKPKTTAKPNVKTPDVNVNDVAHGAKDAGNAAADQVSSWDATTWQMISVLAVILIMMWLAKTFPALKWVIIGLGIGIMGVLLVVNN